MESILCGGSRFSLVARVLTSKVVFSDGFVGVFEKLWHGGDGVSIKEIDERKFLIRFASRRDMLRVLDMEPWSYKEHLVLLYEIQPGKEVREVEASMASFWVQMHGVPLLNMTTVVARKIGSVLGQVLEVDYTEGEECIGRFLRVRIRLDVQQSLMRGSFVEFPEEGATWVDFRYEFLPEYCFLYGCLGHPSQICVEKLASADSSQNLQDQMMAFAGLEASEDLRGRRLRQHGWKESSDSSPWVSGDSTDGNMCRRKSYFTRNMREGSGGSKADCSDWRIRRGHTRGGYAEDSNLAGRIRATREAEEQNRQIREVAWDAGILGPHGIIEVSPANSVEPHLPHGGVQTFVDSGIAIDLNAVAGVEERTTVQGTIHEALSNRADVGGNLGGQSEALTYGYDAFNLGPLIFGQPVNSNTCGVGSRSKRGREENENGSMDKRRCAGIRLVSACGWIGSMGSRREITFDDTLIQEAETGLESPRAL
ncbi:unnamed protein product [Prunus armeniaca]|uniref:DUF4283 domain-containing protein n=1 Tax=Prunus armeniaca TaxID=36596 RepID=A0A6J5WZJ9_PRUAR|nr:unnamed protein product [Prunus armeniaca]